MTRVGNEGLLVNFAGERCYQLNSVGVMAWEEIVKGDNLAVIIKKLLAKYDVQEETLRKDLSILLSSLSEAGLIVERVKP